MERKHLVQAARDINKREIVSPNIDITGSVSELKNNLLMAAEFVTDNDKLEDSTRAVLKALKAGDTVDQADRGGDDVGGTKTDTKTAKEPKAAKAPVERKPRESTVVVGDFKPVRAGTKYQTLLLMVEKGKTVQDMAAALEVKPLDLKGNYLYSLRRFHGIDYKIGEDNKVTLILPTGKTIDDCVVTKVETKKVEKAA